MGYELADLSRRFCAAIRGLEDRCGERLEADGVDRSDPEAVESWCAQRHREGDGEVRDLMAAHVASDAIADALDLDLPPVGPCLAQVARDLTDDGLVDDGPLYDLLYESAEACLGLAEGDGVDVLDFGSVKRWVRGRYGAGDADVRSGLDRLVLVDASSVIHSLRGLRLMPVVGGLAQEINSLAFDERHEREGCPPNEEWGMRRGPVGTFRSGAATYKVRVDIADSVGRPHFHVRRLRAPGVADACIAIYEPEYVPHGSDGRGLRPGEVEDLVAFLEGGDGDWPHLSRWAGAACRWDEFHGDEEGTELYYASLRMPDYRGLRWPGEVH